MDGHSRHISNGTDQVGNKDHRNFMRTKFSVLYFLLTHFGESLIINRSKVKSEINALCQGNRNLVMEIKKTQQKSLNRYTKSYNSESSLELVHVI